MAFVATGLCAKNILSISVSFTIGAMIVEPRSKSQRKDVGSLYYDSRNQQDGNAGTVG